MSRLFDRIHEVLLVTDSELPNIEQSTKSLVDRAKEIGITDDASDETITKFIDKNFDRTKKVVKYTKDSIEDFSAIERSLVNIKNAIVKKKSI